MATDNYALMTVYPAVSSVCLCVIKFVIRCLQKLIYGSLQNLSDIPYMLPWKWLTLGADNIHDGLSHMSFNHIIVFVDHGD